MPKIYPFSPYELQMDFVPFDAAQLKPLLEPSECNGYLLEECNHYFRQMLEDGRYGRSKEKSVYIYKHTLQGRQVLGLWCRIDANSYANGEILGHELTLDQTITDLRTYRGEVGLEGSPVLLAYRPETKLDQLLANWSIGLPNFSHQKGDELYEFWRLASPEELSLICSCVYGIVRLYIADGHHRMAAAASLRERLSVLMVSSEQLQIQGYHRVVEIPNDFSRDELISTIEEFWDCIPVPTDNIYCPDRKRRIGMNLQGSWYQLDLKEGARPTSELSDAQLLQETVLSKGMGIHDAQQSSALAYYADGELPAMLIKLKEETRRIAFTLFPISVEDLLAIADNRITLPPKSTWIEPKAPYELLIDNIGDNKLISNGATSYKK